MFFLLVTISKAKSKYFIFITKKLISVFSVYSILARLNDRKGKKKQNGHNKD